MQGGHGGEYNAVVPPPLREEGREASLIIIKARSNYIRYTIVVVGVVMEDVTGLSLNESTDSIINLSYSLRPPPSLHQEFLAEGSICIVSDIRQIFAILYHIS